MNDTQTGHVVIVSHEYALLCLRALSHREPHLRIQDYVVPANRQNTIARAATPTGSEVRKLLNLREHARTACAGGPRETICPQILVSSKDSRVRSPYYHEHYMSQPLPTDALWKTLGTDVYCSSPEMIFAQLSKGASMVDLCMLGMELCGSYGLPYIPDLPLVNRDPLTTPERLSRTLGELDGYGPRSNAGRALACIAAGSASPMESRLFLALTAPRSMGGLNLPRPLLNDPVSITREQQRLLGKGNLKCDLIWPEHRLALEYESHEHHGRIDNYEATMARNAVLQMNGIKVISISASTFYNYDKLMTIVDQIKHTLGLRHRPETEQMQRKTRELLRLLGDAPSF